MENDKKESGTVILELSIVLPFFIILMLVIYGFFGLFATQCEMKQAFVQTVESLSMDPYLTGKVGSAYEQGTVFWGDLSDMILDIARSGNSDNYSSKGDWYKTGGDSTVAMKRFYGFLSGGDEAKGAEKLKKLKVEDLQISMTVDSSHSIMVVTMNYNYHYLFDFLKNGKIPASYTMQARLWTSD